ncbi:MAG: vanadium-dependent haloperoxidase [Candidatus Eisenbacteria bacterium]
MKRVSLAATVGALALVPASANAFDPILHWTDTSNALIRSLNQTRACPCPISRGVAMMYLAMYDAVNSIDGTHEPYLVDLNAPPGASMEAAAVMAAHDVLLSIYPIRQGMLDNAMNADLALIPDGQSKTDGIAIGHAAAQAIIAARTGDGSSIDPTYGGENSIGHWHPTWPDFRTGCHSMWGHVTPFGLTAGNQFLPPAPPALTSQQYTDAFNEVKLYGSEYGDEANTYQREIAYFWANDQDGTSKPPGQLCDMFKIISQLQGLGTVENARLFAYLGMCLGDAGIACWDSKYDTDLDFWRPISGIREADADGNPNTLADPEWVPLCHFTPNFPAYTSGHSTFGGAASQQLRRYLGFDDFTWTQTTDDPHLDAGWTREMHSFTQAEVENHDSRIWLGVHWRFDCDAGRGPGTSPRRLGLRQLPSPGQRRPRNVLGRSEWARDRTLDHRPESDLGGHSIPLRADGAGTARRGHLRRAGSRGAHSGLASGQRIELGGLGRDEHRPPSGRTRRLLRSRCLERSAGRSVGRIPLGRAALALANGLNRKKENET